MQYLLSKIQDRFRSLIQTILTRLHSLPHTMTISILNVCYSPMTYKRRPLTVDRRRRPDWGFLVVDVDQTELFYWSTVNACRRPSTSFYWLFHHALWWALFIQVFCTSLNSHTYGTTHSVQIRDVNWSWISERSFNFNFKK